MNQSEELLNQIISRTESLPIVEDKDGIFETMANTYAEDGKYDEAITIANKIQNPEVKERPLYFVVEKMITNGLYDKAIELSASTTQTFHPDAIDFHKSDTVYKVQTHKLKNGKVDDVVMFLKTTEGNDMIKKGLFADTINYLLKMSKLQEAEELFDLMPDDNTDVNSFEIPLKKYTKFNIIDTKARLGQVDEAIAMTEAFTDEKDKIRALMGVAFLEDIKN